MMRSSCLWRWSFIACLGSLLPCCSRSSFKPLKKKHWNSCLTSISLLLCYWSILILSYICGSSAFFTSDSTLVLFWFRNPTNKQKRPMWRKLWFFLVAGVWSDRQEQLHSICFIPFFDNMEAEHLPKAEVPSVHLLTHLGVAFLEY